MPNRIIKESICTSENIEALSLEAETFFYRLLVRCDDYGRFDGRPTVLRSSCFPLRVDSVNDAMISAWLQELIDAGLVQEYYIDGHPYLQVIKWDKHQQIRAKRSKYPEQIADDSNGNHLKSNVPVIQSNPIQYTGAEEPAPTHPPPKISELEALFSELTGLPKPDWPTLTKKQKSAAAVRWANPLRDFIKLANGQSADILKEAVRRQKSDGMDISAPASIDKKFKAVYSERHSKRVSATPDL